MEGFIDSMWRSKSMVLRVIVVLIAMNNFEFSNAEMHLVGGTKASWAPNVNFSEWSSHQQFYLGDWLYFGYNKNQYNVLEVNKTSYENCIDKDFVRNITKGGRDVFELTEAKPYYFLSGGGYCFQGMKVSFFVQNAPPNPAPAPHSNDSPAPFLPSHLVVAFTFLFNYALFYLMHFNFVAKTKF